MSVNGVGLKSGSRISFGNQSELTIVCTAINSRPQIRLRVYEPRTNLSLTVLPGRGVTQNPFQACDKDNQCQTVLRVSITPGFAAHNGIRNISCSAENTTQPFNMFTLTNFETDFTS